VDFEIETKVVANNIYGCTLNVLDFMSVINDYRRLLSSNLAIYDVIFIRKQTNEVSHSLARVAPCHASFRIFI